MRIRIVADAASEAQLRKLLEGLAQIGKNAVVGLDGPDHYSAETPPLSPNEFAVVVGQLVKFHGLPLDEVLRGVAR